MGKKMVYTPNQAGDSALMDGAGADEGAIRISYCDATKTAVQDDEKEGWRELVLITNEIDLKPTLEFYEAMAGSPSLMYDKALVGKKVNFTITGIAPSDMAIALANGNKSITYIYPTVPVNTTVDLTTVPAFVPTEKSIRVAAGDAADYVGMEGKEIIMLTGTAVTGQEYEKLVLSAIDVTNDILYFKQAYKQDPEHGAVIKLIERTEFTNSGVTVPTVKLRIEKYDNGKEALTLFILGKCKIDPTGRKLGMKTASEVSFNIDVLPNLVITTSLTESSQVRAEFYKEIRGTKK